ncbi:hypothetical protein [Vibrio cyclitrophicus]|uniref:hypothetical protein n=1 Tax=Vibrio cyclitrophicus TaxID=47951 RepID=UPI000C852955|nr:hypothetical protein [Vibrio cyclitrophicus]PME40629.1 hypothetical protein BCV36_19885 [Vibrio cyclitrophicus]
MKESLFRYFSTGKGSVRLVLSIIWLIFTKPKLCGSKLDSCTDVLSFISAKNWKRNDYKNLHLNYQGYVKKDREISGFIIISKFNWNFSSFIINVFLNTLKAKSNTINLRSLLLECCDLYSFQNRQLFKEFIAQFDGIQRVQTFCDAHPVENIVCCAAKEMGIITETLQHGFYRKVNEDNPNSLAYRNFISDYIYMWDEESKLQFSLCGISPKRIIVTDGFLKSNSICIHEGSSKYIGVVLNGPNDESLNKKIINVAINMARRDDQKIIIRLHPNLNRYKYLSWNFNKLVHSVGYYSNDEYLPMVKYSLINNSGLIHEFNESEHDYLTLNCNLNESFKKISKKLIDC